MAKRRVQSRAAKAQAQRAQITVIVGIAASVLLFVVVLLVALSQSGVTLFGGSVLASTSYAQIPQTTTAEGAPVLGNPDARITLMEYADFSCLHCADYHSSTIKQVIDQYVRTGKARFIFQPFLLGGFGVYSEIASQAALCAGKQGHFWEMQDALFNLQAQQGYTAYSLDAMKTMADSLKLNTSALLTCVNSGETMQTLRTIHSLGEKMGVQGTPSVLFSTDGKTYNFLTDTDGNPIIPALKQIADTIDQANQAG
jgi:protein-disulfide isomerase